MLSASTSASFAFKLTDQLLALLSTGQTVAEKQDFSRPGSKIPSRKDRSSLDCVRCCKYDGMNMRQLRAQCKKMGVKANGRKVELAQRLREKCKCRENAEKRAGDGDSPGIFYEVHNMAGEDAEALEMAISVALVAEGWVVCRGDEKRILVFPTERSTSTESIQQTLPPFLRDFVKITSQRKDDPGESIDLAVKVKDFVKLNVVYMARQLGYLAFRRDASTLIHIKRQFALSFHVALDFAENQSAVTVKVVFSRLSSIRCLPVREQQVSDMVRDRMEALMLHSMEYLQIVSFAKGPDPLTITEKKLLHNDWRPTNFEEAKWYWWNGFGIGVTLPSSSHSHKGFARVRPPSKYNYSGPTEVVPLSALFHCFHILPGKKSTTDKALMEAAQEIRKAMSTKEGFTDFNEVASDSHGIMKHASLLQTLPASNT